MDGECEVAGMAPQDGRRDLASVSNLLDRPDIKALVEAFSHAIVVDTVRQVLDECRRTLNPDEAPPDADAIASRVQAVLAVDSENRLRRVINGTGIMLHTGLGRAVLPKPSADSLGALGSCCNLQIDMATGTRGKRNYVTERLLAALTGAEAAMVVNNNAAATFLILAATCRGREVIVSRGQLIEIGGSYRLPDCVHESGAVLVEVGTTNKTHLRDYEAAITENTAAIMRVNPSNYRIVGFSAAVPIADLVTLGRKHSLTVIDDLGCGALIDLEPYGLPHEPTVPESVAAGVDVACFSGDKLIGGPQSGIIVGKRDVVDRIRTHPLSRMLRVGKLTDMALEQALRLFLEPATLPQTHPTLRMLTARPDDLKAKAVTMAGRLKQTAGGLDIDVIAGESEVGGGSMPATPLPSWLLAVGVAELSARQLCSRLRRHEPPVIARIADGRVCIDMRTLLPGEEQEVVDALAAIEED